MDVGQAIELGRTAVTLSLMVAAPVMVVAVVVGLLISILQAVTQIQDQTISFVPKITAMMVTIIYILPWAMSRMMEYSSTLISDIPSTL